MDWRPRLHNREGPGCRLRPSRRVTPATGLTPEVPASSAEPQQFTVVVSLIGIGVAYLFYVQDRSLPRRLGESASGVYELLRNAYYIDDLYDWITRYLVLNGICWLAQAFDTYVVDGIVNGVASLITDLGSGVRRIETGQVQSYMIGFFGGVAVLAVLAFVLLNVAR